MPLDLSLYPAGAGLDGGRLLIGGCALADVADRFGTPALVVDEGALRARAREYRSAFEARHAGAGVLFATKAFPSASVLAVLAEEGLGLDVASGNELAIAIAARADPAAAVLHGNAEAASPPGTRATTRPPTSTRTRPRWSRRRTSISATTSACWWSRDAPSSRRRLSRSTPS